MLSHITYPLKSTHYRLIFVMVMGWNFYCIAPACAQSPMLAENKFWSFHHLTFPATWTEHYKLEAGNEINGVEYFRQWVATNEAMTNWIETEIFVREEGNRVYFYTTVLGEILAYDFNLIQGDTFHYKDPEYFYESYLTVETVDSVELYNGEFRKRWTLVLPEEMPYADLHKLVWIEGIGSLAGPQYYSHQSLFVVDYNSSLLCYREGEQLVFSETAEPTCHVATNMQNPYRKSWDWMLHPNPAKNSVVIILPEEIEPASGAEIRLYSQLGRPVWSQLMTKPEISIDHLPAGIYFIAVYCEQFILMPKKLVVY